MNTCLVFKKGVSSLTFYEIQYVDVCCIISQVFTSSYKPDVVSIEILFNQSLETLTLFVSQLSLTMGAIVSYYHGTG